MMTTRPCHCGRAAHGRRFRRGRDCAPCWLFLHNPAMRGAWGGDPAATLQVDLSVPDVPTGVSPRTLRAVGPEGLVTEPGGYAFNAGLIRHRGRLLMCYRVGWAGSQVHVAELSEDLRPLRSVHLDLRHPAAPYGREDPRLFHFRDQLHVSFTGVQTPTTESIPTSVFYAPLSDSLRVERVFAPDYCRRTHPQEKNWVFFEHAGGLYSVYGIAPHVVLKIEGDHAVTAGESATPFAWSGGHLRGGASPVLVGDRWHHWFHGRSDEDGRYNVGCCTFEAKPPFRILGMTPDPLLWANPAENARHPNPNYIFVAFPGGAVLEGGVWKVAMGWNDRGIRIAEWDASDVNAALAGPLR